MAKRRGRTACPARTRSASLIWRPARKCGRWPLVHRGAHIRHRKALLPGDIGSWRNGGGWGVEDCHAPVLATSGVASCRFVDLRRGRQERCVSSWMMEISRFWTSQLIDRSLRVAGRREFRAERRAVVDLKCSTGIILDRLSCVCHVSRGLLVELVEKLAAPGIT